MLKKQPKLPREQLKEKPQMDHLRKLSEKLFQLLKSSPICKALQETEATLRKTFRRELGSTLPQRAATSVMLTLLA